MKCLDKGILEVDFECLLWARFDRIAYMFDTEKILAAAICLDDDFDMDGRRMVRLGDGTDMVDEALTLEVACAKGISVASATWQLFQAVRLQSWHPAAFQAVQDGC